jgi:uncharacterized membrane protein YeaQ/YmgE (transglycosylase-associated protein family)
MTTYIVQAVLGAVIGFLGNNIPFIKNNQSSITNAILGVVGSVGGSAAIGATGMLPDTAGMAGTVGTGVVGSIVGLLAGKLFKSPTA